MGDPASLIYHNTTAGMGGLRTAGDLVSRIQFDKRMKIGAAKDYVAKKLDLTTDDLVDETVMREKREELGLGLIDAVAGQPYGIESKFNIEKVLDIKINCCERFRRLYGKNM